jgi:hypothetical protein
VTPLIVLTRSLSQGLQSTLKGPAASPRANRMLHATTSSEAAGGSIDSISLAEQKGLELWSCTSTCLTLPQNFSSQTIYPSSHRSLLPELFEEFTRAAPVQAQQLLSKFLQFPKPTYLHFVLID